MASDEPGPGPSQELQPGTKGDGTKDGAGEQPCCGAAGVETGVPEGLKGGPEQCVCLWGHPELTGDILACWYPQGQHACKTVS